MLVIHKEKILLTRISSLFCFFPYVLRNLKIKFSSANAFNIKLTIKLSLTHYSIDIHFNASATDNFRKHCEKKKKLLITSNFFFFPQCFYTIIKSYHHLSTFMISYLYLLPNLNSPKLVCEVKG